MSNASDTVEQARDGTFADLELQHDLHLMLGDWQAWAAVAEQVRGAGADVATLHLSRLGEAYTARCRLKHISSDDARALSSALLDAGLVRGASVEHLMLARSAFTESAS
jgi:hypothetical protein